MMANRSTRGLIAACTALATLATGAAHATTLEDVRAADVVTCAVNGSRPGFSAVDSRGEWNGLDIDTCRAVAAASSVIQTEDVFEQNNVSGPTTASTAANTARLASIFSTIASMMRSLSASGSKLVVPLRRPIVTSRSSVVSLPRVTPLPRNRSIRPRPASTAAWSTSRTMVRYPAWAHTCAMPEPISPQPRTPTTAVRVSSAIIVPFSPPRVRRRPTSPVPLCPV